MPPIVYISPYYIPTDLSGGNRRFNEICERFTKEFGQDFTLIVTKGMTPPWWDGRSKLVEIEYSFNHWSKFAAMREIGKYLDSIPPSIVVLESVPIPFRALRRHTHFQVAYDFRYFTNRSKGFFYRLAFSNYLKHQWRNSEHIVTCTDFSIDELEKYVGYPRERVLKSYFGIDARVLDIAHTPAPEKDIDLIYVGHYERRKNHAPLLRAIAKVDPTLKAYFLGRDNGLKDSLIALKNELGLVNTTITTESKTDEELWKLYRRSKIFAYPSVYEGFGIPLIEALALDIPVVCTDMPVFHEVGGPFPAFFNPDDPSDIAEKITHALTNPKTPPLQEIRAHLEKFFWENIYQGFVADLKKYTAQKLER